MKPACLKLVFFVSTGWIIIIIIFFKLHHVYFKICDLTNCKNSFSHGHTVQSLLETELNELFCDSCWCWIKCPMRNDTTLSVWHGIGDVWSQQITALPIQQFWIIPYFVSHAENVVCTSNTNICNAFEGKIYSIQIHSEFWERFLYVSYF